MAVSVTTGTYDGSTAISFQWYHYDPTFITTLDFTSDKRMRASISTPAWTQGTSRYGYTYTVYARNSSGSYSDTILSYNGNTEGNGGWSAPSKEGSYYSIDNYIYNGYIYIGATCTADDCTAGLTTSVQAIFQIEYDEPKNFVYIYNASSGVWNTYTPYIYTSNGWTEYEPYIYTSSGWTEY